MTTAFCERLRMTVPVIQAPMAGTSTAALAAAVSEAGGLGSIAVGAVDAATAEAMILDVRARTQRPFNVNVFCHRPARPDRSREAAWLARLAPEFARFGVAPPAELREIYTSFLADPAMLSVLLRHRPAVVSFHFGLPPASVIASIRQAGSITLATVTNAAEADAAAAAGVDALVAQGYEAGGHRGVFAPDAPDPRLATIDLVRLVIARQPLPVIAAGGIMDGAGVAAMLSLGAAAAQLGTAFVACPESAASPAYRAALAAASTAHTAAPPVNPTASATLTAAPAARTVMTRVLSGRPARCLANAFTRLGEGIADHDVPDYPIAYDAGKALDAAARTAGEPGYGAQWAGEGAPRTRSMAAGDLIRTLSDEIDLAVSRSALIR